MSFLTGATAAQIIPEVVKGASHVRVYQRSPNWVLDRNNASISPITRTLYQLLPVLRTRTRASMMDSREEFHKLITDGHSDMAEKAHMMTTRKLREAFPHDEEMRLKLRPNFHPGCKRVILSDDYLPALSHAHCTLETRPIVRMTRGGIAVSANDLLGHDGIEDAQFDLVVLATGFRAVDHLYPLKITGAHGRSLSDVWEGGARALYGVMIEDMPNFGVLYGPNTNLAHNSLILQIESQARYLATLVDAVLSSKDEGKNLGISPRKKVVETYNENLQRQLGKTSFADTRCSSWFKDRTGLITTNWSGTAIEYQKLMSTVRWDDFEFTGSGADRFKQLEHTKLGRVVEETAISNQTFLVGASAALLSICGWLLLKM
jgi:cation diffusion facilitator CzcD-associated flavoprotein CzcO